MPMRKTVLAFDFGASSGRAVLAHFENGRMTLEEVHRFSNDPVPANGHFYWDVLRLLHEIRIGLQKGWAAGGYDSVGLDTWGVDYALIGKNGDLLGNPHHYRDTRTTGLAKASGAYISPARLYELTGNQIMNINTAFQLFEDTRSRPELLDAAQCFLLMPDLLAYLLTGDLSAERSIAGTTQLFDPRTGTWSQEVIHALGIPERLFPAVVPTGTVKGMLAAPLCEELGIRSVPVIAVCGHDTQCAAAAVPAADDTPFAFISCGTWALFGTELHAPVISPLSAKLGVSNEVGFGGTVDVLKNITGLWLMQETRRTLRRLGRDYSYAQMEEMAASAKPAQCFIDTDASIFGTPGDMVSRIRSWCSESGQPVPQDDAAVLRCIYESLACRFRDALDEITACTERPLRRIYMLGGGVRDALLCQLTADVCGIPVLTGPVEATAMGNAAIQLMASGAVENLASARAVIGASVPVRTYAPDPGNAYIYNNYQKIIKKEV